MVKTAIHMRDCRLAAVAAGALLAALGGCKDEGKLREAEMTQLLALLPGEYDNRAQAALDARNGARPSHDAVTLTITRVFTPRLGHHVYYAQETVVDDPRRVLSQKMYSFQVDEKRGIIETTYAFVEPLRWRDDLEGRGGALCRHPRPQGLSGSGRQRRDAGGVQRRRPDARRLQVPQGSLGIARAAGHAAQRLECSAAEVISSDACLTTRAPCGTTVRCWRA